MKAKYTEYLCVMDPPPSEHVLNSETQTFNITGTLVQIPSQTLFVLEDGSIYVQMIKHGDKAEYVSLATLVKLIKTSTLIENFSKK